MKLVTSAPSNIALIKYMGKVDTMDNRPANSSLSWTLDGLRTQVEIEFDEALKGDVWEPMQVPGAAPLVLSDKGQKKFLKHIQRMRDELKLHKHTEASGEKLAAKFFRVRSSNNFPSDSGIASSASSFAALTKATYQAFAALEESFHLPHTNEQAEMSRRGSGSSCRSFFAPWALWGREVVRPLELPMGQLVHQLLLVDAGKKEVSSSEAHERCLTSLLFSGRPQRAESRLADLLAAFRAQDWERIYQLTWAEFWDMHLLFETSSPAFGYLRPGSMSALLQLRDLWNLEKDGPVVTMDAGANVHLLWRNDQTARAVKFAEQMQTEMPVLMTSVDGVLKTYGGTGSLS